MTIRSYRSTAFAWLLLAAAPVAFALDVAPSITLAEIYTSNVNLDSTNEESEWITRVAPAVEITYEGSRLDLRADYTLEALFYAYESDRNEVYNQLSSSALLDVIGDELQLRGDISISQVNVSPEEPVSNSNINTTGNRTDALTWEVGPQWRKDLFSGSEVDGHLYGGNVDYDDPETQDITTTSGRLSFHTDGRTDPTITYDLAYEYDRLEYDITGETVVQTAYLELGYRLNETWRVFAMGGLDSNFASTAEEGDDDHSLDEPRWEAGVSASFPSDSFRVAVGHRYFGSTFGLSWDHLETDAVYSLSYDESPTTSDLAALREIPTDTPNDPDPDPIPPDSDIDRPGNPTRYIRKRADADASWTLHRSTLSVNAFWEDREDQALVFDELDEDATLDDESSYGFNANVSWELGTRSVASFGASWRHREVNDFDDDVPPGDPIAVTGIDDELYTVQAAYDYMLGLSTSIGSAVGYRTRQGESSDASGDYDEFWASVQLVRAF